MNNFNSNFEENKPILFQLALSDTHVVYTLVDGKWIDHNGTEVTNFSFSTWVYIDEIKHVFTHKHVLLDALSQVKEGLEEYGINIKGINNAINY